LLDLVLIRALQDNSINYLKLHIPNLSVEPDTALFFTWFMQLFLQEREKEIYSLLDTITVLFSETTFQYDMCEGELW
jgi:hypothetical protein